eukprot:TRINITY_DN2438_c0_g1_i1.p1 TRINITY_DN2438_c0_g1~~TRINITY_DN2438_c0_g1_i1.p1  ORF type:complete len:371 (-),score=83.73 TRINITY_DN2438_c0_g1_i1:35-1147(-)
MAIPGSSSVSTISGSPMQKFLVILSLISVQFMYAGYHVFSKVAISDHGISPFIVALMRNSIAVPLLFIFTFTVGGMPLIETSDLPRLVLLALLGVVGNQCLLLTGLQYTSPVSAALMQLLVPIIGTLLSVLVGEEKIDLKSKTGIAKIVGILFSVGGAAVLVEMNSGGSGFSGKASNLVIGHLLYLGNSSCYAGFIVFMKPVLIKYPASRVIFWTLLIGSVMMVLICIPFLNAHSWANLDGIVWGCFAYCGVVASCMAFVVMSWANHRSSSVVVSAFSALLPLATATLSYAFLSVKPSLWDLLGAALLILGLFVLCTAKYKESLAALKGYMPVHHRPAEHQEERLLQPEHYSEDDMFVVRDQDFESAHSA